MPSHSEVAAKQPLSNESGSACTSITSAAGATTISSSSSDATSKASSSLRTAPSTSNSNSGVFNATATAYLARAFAELLKVLHEASRTIAFRLYF
jgi:hypothetical protein